MVPRLRQQQQEQNSRNLGTVLFAGPCIHVLLNLYPDNAMKRKAFQLNMDLDINDADG